MSQPDPRHDIPLTVTVLDTVTGEQGTQNTPFGTYWWAEGNGSCDCNRATFFPEQVNEAGNVVDEDTGYCRGCIRYRIVDAQPLLAGYTLADFNEGYPELNGAAP